MSDAYYQERAKRRSRLLWLFGGLLVLLIAAILGVRALYYDACTGGFERAPRSIVSTFVDAVGRGDRPVAHECWEHEAYYDLEAGCSEICLSRALGMGFDLLEIDVGEPHTTPSGRDNMTATVTIACEDGQTHTGEIVLDSVGANVPWKHWAIVRSTFGGTLGSPWCR